MHLSNLFAFSIFLVSCSIFCSGWILLDLHTFHLIEVAGISNQRETCKVPRSFGSAIASVLDYELGFAKMTSSWARILMILIISRLTPSSSAIDTITP